MRLAALQANRRLVRCETESDASTLIPVRDSGRTRGVVEKGEGQHRDDDKKGRSTGARACFAMVLLAKREEDGKSEMETQEIEAVQGACEAFPSR